MRTSSFLLLGGTFDPPHVGHLVVARTAAEAIGAPGVTLLPAAQSPHKQGVTTSAEHRLNMLHAAVEGDPFFEVSTLDLERPSPSYTYDTVQNLFQRGLRIPNAVDWLIGGDQLMSLPRWHRAAELMQLVRFWVAVRPGSLIDFGALPATFSHLEGRIVQTPHLDISSTDIRDRVRAGKSIRYLVPEGVAEYIKTHDLYVR